MNLKFFILGLYVLVSIAQISTAQQSQEAPFEDEEGGEGEGDAPAGDSEDQGDEEIEQRRKITSVMNSAVNIVEQPEVQQKQVYTQMQSHQNTGYMAPPARIVPIPRPVPFGIVPRGGLLGTLFDLGSNLLPLLKPLLGLLKTMWPVLKNLLGPLLKAIMKELPLLSNLFELLKPLLKFPAKIAMFLKTLFNCLRTILVPLLKGLKFLLNGLKTLYNLLPVIPYFVELIPNLIGGLWRCWRSVQYVVLSPVRVFYRWLHWILHLIYGVPRYLGAVVHAIGHLIISPAHILGFLFRRAFLVFNDFVIVPVARLKYFLINLFDVLLGPLNITRHFLEEVACLFVRTPLRVIRSIMRAFFVNGILNTIRYIKTVIYEVIAFPWSHHYAHMFPSLGNIHNYNLPNQIACHGNFC